MKRRTFFGGAFAGLATTAYGLKTAQSPHRRHPTANIWEDR